MTIDLVGKAVRRFRLPTVEYNNEPIKIVPAQQGDANSRYFIVTLYDDRGDIDLTDYSTVVISATLPDKTVQYYGGDINKEDNTIIIKIPASMMEQRGKSACNITVSYKNEAEEDILLTSQTFYLFIVKSQGGDGAGEAENDPTSIVSIVGGYANAAANSAAAAANSEANAKKSENNAKLSELAAANSEANALLYSQKAELTQVYYVDKPHDNMAFISSYFSPEPAELVGSAIIAITSDGFMCRFKYNNETDEWDLLDEENGGFTPIDLNGAGIVSIEPNGQDSQGGNIYKITLNTGETYSFTAPKGEKGDKGENFAVDNWYSSVEEMQEDYDNSAISVGDIACIEGSLDLYVKGDENWMYKGSMKGTEGDLNFFVDKDVDLAYYTIDEEEPDKDYDEPLTVEQLRNQLVTGELIVAKSTDADNVTETINDKLISSIFETNGTTVKNASLAASATNVTGQINGENISSIFETDGITAKKSTNAVNVSEKISGKNITDIFETDGTTVKSATSSSNVTQEINGTPLTSIFETDGVTVKSATTATKIKDNTLTNSLHLPKIYVNTISKRPSSDGAVNVTDYLTISSKTLFSSEVIIDSSLIVNDSVTANRVNANTVAVGSLDASGSSGFIGVSHGLKFNEGCDIEGVDTVQCGHVTTKSGYIIYDPLADSTTVHTFYTLTLPQKSGTIALTSDIPTTKYFHAITIPWYASSAPYDYSGTIYVYIILNQSTSQSNPMVLTSRLLEMGYTSKSNFYPAMGELIDASSGTSYIVKGIYSNGTGNGLSVVFQGGQVQDMRYNSAVDTSDAIIATIS